MIHGVFFSGWFCSIAALIWGFGAILLVLKIQREECDFESSFPLHVLAAVGITAALAGFLMPAPMNLAVALAIGGLLPAAWSDWNTTYLWDEVIVPTAIMVGGAMMIGGTYCALWAGALISKREIGLGDVKMAAVIGMALGPLAGMIAFFVAPFIGIALWAIRKRSPLTEKEHEIPYGPALVGAMLITCGFAPLVDTSYGFLLPAWFAVQP